MLVQRIVQTGLPTWLNGSTRRVRDSRYGTRIFYHVEVCSSRRMAKLTAGLLDSWLVELRASMATREADTVGGAANGGWPAVLERQKGSRTPAALRSSK